MNEVLSMIKEEVSYGEKNLKANLAETMKLLKDRIETMENYGKEGRLSSEIDVLHSIVHLSLQAIEHANRANGQLESLKTAMRLVANNVKAN